MDRYLQQNRRALRADQFDRPGVRRSAGQTSRHRPETAARRTAAAQTFVGQPFALSRTPSQIAATPPATGPAHRRGAQGIRFQRHSEIKALRDAKARLRSLAMTDKMLSRKEGEGRLRDLQQSGAAQRRLAGDVGSRRRASSTTSRPTRLSASSSSPAPAAKPSSPAPTFPSSRRSARARRRSTATTPPSIAPTTPSTIFPSRPSP